MKTDNTAEHIKKKTAELLGIEDAAKLEYITQDLVDADSSAGLVCGAEESDVEGEKVIVTLWGHNTRYGTRTINGKNYQVYYYEYGGRAPTNNRSLACSNAGGTFWLRMDQFDHHYDGKCPSGYERWRFTRK
jgi:hypothetical protein